MVNTGDYCTTDGGGRDAKSQCFVAIYGKRADARKHAMHAEAHEITRRLDNSRKLAARSAAPARKYQGKNQSFSGIADLPLLDTKE